MITAVRYISEDNTYIRVTYDTGKFADAPWPNETWLAGDVLAWIDAGNVIEPFDPYYDWPLSQAQSTKSLESEAYAGELITVAYGNPQIGVSTDSVEHKRRTESRRKDKSDKLAGEITLTQEEKDESKTDQKLTEYEVKCWAASDKVITNVFKESEVADIMAMDVATNTVWPIWETPV